jgi:hypothetical protein
METKMKLTNFDAAIEVLLDAIRTDYRDWTERSAIAKMHRGNGTGDFDTVNVEMIEEFEEALDVKRGSKYTKIIKGGSVWGFVVNADNGKFRAGDILKAASWAAPATNAARGNIFDGYGITWTGPRSL